MKNLIKFGVLALLAILIFVDSHTAGAASMAGLGIFGGGNFKAMKQRAKERLSSYDGLNNGGGNASCGCGTDSYTGYGDEFLDFGGIGADFASVISKARNFTLTVASAHTATQNLLILPGLTWTPGGTNASTIVDGSVNGLTSVTTGSGSTGTIRQFLEFVRSHPTQWLGMKVSSDVAAQINVQFTYEEETFERSLGNTPVNLANFSDETAYKDKVVTCDLRNYNFVFGKQTKLTMPIVASSSTTFTFWFGAALNTQSALKVKGEAARMSGYYGR